LQDAIQTAQVASNLVKVHSDALHRFALLIAAPDLQLGIQQIDGCIAFGDAQAPDGAPAIPAG